MNDFCKRTALVTGGSGFIGTWVIRELIRQGIPAVAYDTQHNAERWRAILGNDADRPEFVVGDLRDRDKLMQVCEQHDIGYLIHLAALLTPACQADPWLGADVNIMGTLSVFEVARQCAGRIHGVVYASSYAVYGPEADDSVSAIDSSRNRPTSFYGAFKLSVDLIAEQYWSCCQVASVAIRPHVVYGPERDQGLTAGPSLAAKAAARGKDYCIGYTGRVGYDYVEDVAQSFVRAALLAPPGAIIVDLPSQNATPEEFVSVINSILPGSNSLLSVSGPSIPSNIPPKPRPITDLFPDWNATTLYDGIRRTIDFYR